MKILVTGSTGLVGSEAVRFFEEKGWEVIGVDNNARSYFFGTPKKTGALDIDIRSEGNIDALFEQHKFDAIIHAAAQPSHDWAKREPLTDFDINARGTLILLEATRKHCPEAVFVYVSTDKVYGENFKTKHTWETHLIEKETRFDIDPYARSDMQENMKLDCTLRSLFGCSKLAADLYVQEYGRYFGMKTACFRPGCITGRQHEGAEYHGFLAYLTKCIKEGIPYKVFGYKGKQVRDQIHAYDLVNAFYCFIMNPKIAAVYNIGGGPDRSISILEAIGYIEEWTSKKAIVEFLDEPRKGDRIWDIHLTVKFMADYPEWKYEYSLDDIIKDVCS